MTTTLAWESVLAHAEAAASAGDWSTCLTALQELSAIEPDNPGICAAIGNAHLQLGQFDLAAGAFRQVCELTPESADAHNNLGVALWSAGDAAGSEAAYRQGLQIEPRQIALRKNLAVMLLAQDDRLNDGVQVLVEALADDPKDADLNALMAQCYEEAGDLSSALTMYRRTLEFQPGHPLAVAAMERFDPQTRDLSRIAKPEHASKLASLKKFSKNAAPKTNGTPAAATPKPAPSVIAFYGPASTATDARIGVMARALHAQGTPVYLSTSFNIEDAEAYDRFVFANPHVQPGLTDAVEACVRAGRHVTVDIDRDFHHIPADQPGFDQFGPGNPQSLHDLEQILGWASEVTVASRVLVERYAPFCGKISYRPYQLDLSNPLWQKAPPRRRSFNLGLTAAYTTVKDAALLKAALKRILAEFPDVTLVVAGDPNLYTMFSQIAESRKLYLPPTSPEDFPYTLAHIDLVLLPLRDNLYNQARSDLPLREAQARDVRWLATPIPSFKDWGAGGDFVLDADWYTALRTLLKAR